MLAAAWMMASMIANVGELVLVHWLGPGWPPPLQLFWRQAAGLVLLLPFIAVQGQAAFRTRTWKAVLFRSACAMGGLALWIYAATRLPLATATVLSFTRPLWIVILAGIVLGERISAIKWAGVLLGFAGVVVMVQPGATMIEPWAQAAAIASSLLFAFSFVTIKSMSGDNNPMVIIVWSCVLGVAFTAVPAAATWRTPSPVEFAVLSGLGVASLLAFMCMLKAMSFSGAAALMPMDYLRLPMITLAGILLFHEYPDAYGLAGGALILVAALATALGDRGRRAVPAEA
jgi:drug/metabolite transporter (DMT)-like permease